MLDCDRQILRTHEYISQSSYCPRVRGGALAEINEKIKLRRLRWNFARFYARLKRIESISFLHVNEKPIVMGWRKLKCDCRRITNIHYCANVKFICSHIVDERRARDTQTCTQQKYAFRMLDIRRKIAPVTIDNRESSWRAYVINARHAVAQ